MKTFTLQVLIEKFYMSRQIIGYPCQRLYPILNKRSDQYLYNDELEWQSSPCSAWLLYALQGILDADCFLDVCIGWPGNVHDVCVFVHSPIYSQITEKDLLPNKWSKCTTFSHWRLCVSIANMANETFPTELVAASILPSMMPGYRTSVTSIILSLQLLPSEMAPATHQNV